VSSAVFILAVGAAPSGAFAADHLDAPTIAKHGNRDITDVFAWSTNNGNKTVFVIGYNPGAGALPTSDTTFGPNVRYKLKVDTNGDLKPDVTYKLRFGAPNGSGRQHYSLYRNGANLVDAMTGANTSIPGGGMVTAGLFDDPFFFDLDAFKGQVLGNGNGRSFCDGNEVDFFQGLNLTAVVLRVPNSWVGGNNANLGVWATTEVEKGGHWSQADQMGRPAINTVFNNADSHKQDKELFNRTQPAQQGDLGFATHARQVLESLGGDPNLADVLIPDVLTYETSNTNGFLNGRKLTDDVIDAELGLVTGGGLTSDCIDNDSNFRTVFPYLQAAN